MIKSTIDYLVHAEKDLENSYIQEVVPKAAKAVQIKETRQSFYAGFTMGILEMVGLMEEKGVDASNIKGYINDYIESVKDRVTRFEESSNE